MTSTSTLRIPALCVRVTCVPSNPLEQLAATGSAFADVLCGITGLATAAVPLPADAILLSTAHPVADSACAASAQEDGVWSLQARDVALDRSTTHPLAVLVPGLRLQVQCAGVPGSDRTAYSHLLSCSVPLAACFKDLLVHNVHTLVRTTCEDGMQYMVQVMADTRGLPLAAMQQTAADLQSGIDVLLHHQSAMAAALGAPLRTADELVAEVAALKEQRARAVSSVLTALSAGDQANNMLDLQYGRAFGMRVDQQQCRALREGSVLGHGFEQTLLHASIAQASLVAKIAQGEGVHTGDPLLVQRAVENFVRTNGADALVHAFNEQAQTVYCSRTGYQFDPSFAPGMNVARAAKNTDGSLTVTVVPQLALQATPGEDQNLTPGIHFADVLGFANTNGLLRRDCEDGAHALSAYADLFRCVNAQHLLASQASVLQQLPADVQAVGGSILYVSSVLQQHAAQAEAAHTAAEQVPLASISARQLAARADAKPLCSPSLFATSLLASAPQLSVSLSSASGDPSAKLDCTAKEYNAWWTGALMSGAQTNLSGHAVSMSLGLAPLCSTSVDGTRVDLHLLDPAVRVFESTAFARQMHQADTAAVKLNVSKAPVTPVRRNLQQKLDQCGPLTMCMACNLRSTLHAEETKHSVGQAMQAEMLLTGGAMGAAAQPAASIVPMQTFTLRAEASSQPELSRQMAFTFYKTLLSCGRGLVYTLDTSAQSVFAGTPMARELANTHPFVIGAPLGAVETRHLRALGALQSSFVLGAAQALAHLPPLMPLALQQRMRFCPMRQQLAPLTAPELREAKHGCGMLAQTAVLSVLDAAGAAEPAATVANMQALHSAASRIVGPDLHVTGGPFADSLLLTFA